jgi:hypothetical protein
MARGRKHTPEQVVNLLRQIEVAVANGKTTAQGCKEAGSPNKPTIDGGRNTVVCRWTRRGG